jgi:hypothetical protein
MKNGMMIPELVLVGCKATACYGIACRDPGSNRGPSDLQSDALPTELSRLVDGADTLDSNRIAYQTFNAGVAQPRQQGWPWGRIAKFYMMVVNPGLAIPRAGSNRRHYHHHCAFIQRFIVVGLHYLVKRPK